MAGKMTQSAFQVLCNASEILGRRTMQKVGALTLARVFVGLLDIVGILFLSVFSAAALKSNNDSLSSIPALNFLEFSPLVTLAIALSAMSIKSVLSYYLNLIMTKILNSRCSEIIADRGAAIADTDKEILDSSTTQNLHYTVTAGIRAGTVGVIGPLSILISEGSLIILFSFFLLITNWAAALLTVVILGVTSRQLHRFLSHRQYRIGQLLGSAGIRSLSEFQESMHGYKELLVRGNLLKSLSRFSGIENDLSNLQTRQTALSTLPRHVLETVVMLTLGIIATTAILFKDVESAILLLTVFAATTARILPSLIPVQASLSEIQINLGKAFEVNKVFELGGKSKGLEQSQGHNLLQLAPSLEFNSVSYSYPGAENQALREVDFNFRGPGWYAIDGPSGSGKSTIFDLLMGIRVPCAGNVLICGLEPWTYISQNPGYCAYLPQRISVTNNSIAENIAYGLSIEEIDLTWVRSLISLVGLEQIILRSDNGLLEPIGELGNSISGGQLQRLGIARCLYTRPSIILLDESTSGLDRETQLSILDLIADLATEIIIVSISHDETITRRAKEVVRIFNGQLVQVRHE